MILQTALILASLSSGPHLKIDPLLVRQAAETWSVIAGKNNPVWPGWNASSTPLLIYMPGVQDVLINHPKPPAGYVPYQGPVRFPGGKIFVKDGPTQIEFDGQNTSTDVGGVTTLVVADTLSSRRQNLQSLVEQARAGEVKVDDFIQPDPYTGMALTVHEAFHVYQHTKAPNKGGNELALLKYPALDVDNNTGYAMEAEALRSAALADNSADLRRFAMQWLSLREARRKALGPELGAYEDGAEFNEGLAKYTEYRLFQALEKRKPGADMWLVQGFRGYDDLSDQRKRMLNRMVDMMQGKVNVNNDPYGASPVRMRLYFSGMAVGVLLDKLGVSWHDRILQPGTTLTGLATEALKATPNELENAYAEVAGARRYRDIRIEKEKLAADGKVYTEKMVADFEATPGQLVLDYSKTAKPKVGVSFTPFGILRIDGERVMYRLLPIRGIVNDLSFAEDSARPVLQHVTRQELVVSLTGAVSEAMLDKAAPGWRNGPVQIESLELPGVSVKKINGTIRLDGKRLVITVK